MEGGRPIDKHDTVGRGGFSIAGLRLFKLIKLIDRLNVDLTWVVYISSHTVFRNFFSLVMI